MFPVLILFVNLIFSIMNKSKNIQLVLDILQNEAEGNVAEALKKITKDYKMTWVYQAKSGELFPSTGGNLEREMEEVYPIKNREYDIRNIAEGDGVVMVEMVESYPDPKTGQMYRTPQVIVLEFNEEGLLRTGRHYTDPRLSYLELTKEQVDKALRDTETKVVIKDNR